MALRLHYSAMVKATRALSRRCFATKNASLASQSYPRVGFGCDASFPAARVAYRDTSMRSTILGIGFPFASLGRPTTPSSFAGLACCSDEWNSSRSLTGGSQARSVPKPSEAKKQMVGGFQPCLRGLAILSGVAIPLGTRGWPARASKGQGWRAGPRGFYTSRHVP